jgi:hypothetical protein
MSKDSDIGLLVKELMHRKYTVPKDSENFYTNNYGTQHLLSVEKVSVIDNLHSGTVAIGNEIC